MKYGSLFSALALATVAQCGLVQDIEDVILGKVDDLLAELPESRASATASSEKMMAHLHELVGNRLGPIPADARDAFASVFADVPQAVGELKQQMLDELRKTEPKTSPAKAKPAKLKENKGGDWKYHVTDERFPNHALRAKSPESLGIDKVKQYSGYLDLEEEDKHFFYWFFESRNDPKNDPVVLWLNGGPGCSSLTGLFFELGPASIGEDLKPVHNKFSWNNNANVIFLDQPVNTGYSYSDSASVSDTVTAGKDAYAFLELFFKQFPEYTGRDFHIAGESYAGHYIPVFASEIVSHDDRSFNLTSLLIGNGLTDPLRQYDLYEPMACGKGGHPSVLDDESCQKMLDSQPRCNQLIESCYNSQSAWTCVPAAVYCNNVAFGPYQQTGLNVYDIREQCSDSGSGLCYPQLDYVTKYLNLPEVKEATGSEVEEFVECNTDVNRNFLFNGDWMKPYYTSVADILERDIPILIYAGDKDFICNWLGNEAWSRELDWSGKDDFAGVELSPWKLKSGKEVGQKRNYEHFTFLRVYEAGHMVPFNQPHAASVMLDRWISGDYTFA